MWLELGAAAGAGLAIGLGVWGLRLVREVHELEGLSASAVGPPAEVVGLWAAPEDQAS